MGLAGSAGWSPELSQTVDQAGDETCPGDDEAEEHRPNEEFGSWSVPLQEAEILGQCPENHHSSGEESGEAEGDFDHIAQCHLKSPGELMAEVARKEPYRICRSQRIAHFY